jgi:hypothetical protein
MKELRVGIATEPMLDDYRNRLIGLLGVKLDAQIIDINIASKWRSEEELVANCIERVLSKQVDFVILVSSTGNGLQMIANKHEQIRAAPIPSMKYVEDAASLYPNMCEIDSGSLDPFSASELVVELFRLLRFSENN